MYPLMFITSKLKIIILTLLVNLRFGCIMICANPKMSLTVWVNIRIKKVIIQWLKRLLKVQKDMIIPKL